MQNSRLIAVDLIEVAPLMIRTVKGEIQMAANGEISHPQYRILANIHRGLNTVGKIAVSHGVSQPAMSKMVESLVQKGLILRSQESTDRRQVCLKLSATGKKLHQDLKAMAAQSLGKKIKQLPEFEQDKLERALADLKQILGPLTQGQ